MGKVFRLYNFNLRAYLGKLKMRWKSSIVDYIIIVLKLLESNNYTHLHRKYLELYITYRLSVRLVVDLWIVATSCRLCVSRRLSAWCTWRKNTSWKIWKPSSVNTWRLWSQSTTFICPWSDRSASRKKLSRVPLTQWVACQSRCLSYKKTGNSTGKGCEYHGRGGCDESCEFLLDT